MNKPSKKRYCIDCRNHFYNGHNHLGIKECWRLKDAKVVTRYRIGTWTQPTQPAAFTKVKTLDCHHEDGQVFWDYLPNIHKKPVLKG